jgi:hypothetical protein
VDAGGGAGGGAGRGGRDFAGVTGSTQFVIKLLIDRTGNPLAPAYYWTGAAVVGLVAMMLVRESAPTRRGATEKARISDTAA